MVPPVGLEHAIDQLQLMAILSSGVEAWVPVLAL
jgi:hypothetical protein